MKALKPAIATLTVVLLTAPFATAQSVEALYKSKCAACHGPDGNSPAPAFPKLAGQYASYIEKSLNEYKSGVRKDPIMAGMAAPLSKEDIENLAAFFASQSGLKTKY